MIKGTGGRGEIAILSFPEITSCKLRVDGFRDILKENSTLQIVTELSNSITFCLSQWDL